MAFVTHDQAVERALDHIDGEAFDDETSLRAMSSARTVAAELRRVRGARPSDEDAALGDDRQVRSELAELRDHLSLPDSATAADVVARAKLVAEWPSCFDLIAERSRWEIVHRAAPEQAGPPPPLCDLPCEGCGTAEAVR